MTRFLNGLTKNLQTYVFLTILIALNFQSLQEQVNKKCFGIYTGQLSIQSTWCLHPQSYHRLYEENAEEHYKAALIKFRELINNKIPSFYWLAH